MSKEQTSIVRNYVAELGSIVECIYTRNQADMDICMVREKFQIAREIPLSLVEQSGPFLWKYRDQIARRDISFFLNKDYEDDIAQYRGTLPEEAVDFDDASEILGKLKRSWLLLTAKEREAITDRIVRMLSLYAEYVKTMRT